jgi:hypothetical protein
MALIYPPTQNGLQKSLGAQLDQGATSSVTLNNTTGIQNLKGLFVVDRIDTNGTEKDAAVREYISFTGVSGSTLTTLVRGLGGTTDQDHAVGAVVEFVNDVVQQQAILDALTNVVTTTGALDTTKVVDLTTAQALTHKDLTDATNVLPVTLTNTVTLTGKRITKRIVSATSYTTNTGSSLNADTTDMFIVTAQAGALLFNAPSGTPVDGQTLWIAVTGTATRALTWNAIFEASALLALPTTTTGTSRIDIAFVYRSDTSHWHIVGVI